MTEPVKNKGWAVTCAGIGINLALGILYTWSLFKASIAQSIESGEYGGFDWDPISLNDPYAVCCLAFAFATILSSKCQDRFGPRVTAFLGGILVSVGFLCISQTVEYIVWVLGFGVLTGIGIGLGYAAAAYPALKWFPPSKMGLIAGLIVSGFGLASFFLAPLSKYLITVWGLQSAMLFFGIALFIVVTTLAAQLEHPPYGYIPQKLITYESTATENAQEVQRTIKAIRTERDFTPGEVLRTRAFYLLWIIYFVGAGTGLMVISGIAGMAQKSMGTAAFWTVSSLAVGNAAGRIVASVYSERIGRRLTLLVMLLGQGALMFLAIPFTGSEHTAAVVMLVLTASIGFAYSTNLYLFPAFTKDLYGLKNFGINYGLVFTAWGVGGSILSRVSQMLYVRSGSYASSFLVAGILLIIGSLLTFRMRQMKRPENAV